MVESLRGSKKFISFQNTSLVDAVGVFDDWLPANVIIDRDHISSPGEIQVTYEGGYEAPNRAFRRVMEKLKLGYRYNNKGHLVLTSRDDANKEKRRVKTNLQNENTSIQFRNATLTDALSSLRQKTNLHILVRRSAESSGRTISVKANNESSKEILTSILEPFNMDYLITPEGVIIVAEQGTVDSLDGRPNVLHRSPPGVFFRRCVLPDNIQPVSLPDLQKYMPMFCGQLSMPHQNEKNRDSIGRGSFGRSEKSTTSEEEDELYIKIDQSAIPRPALVVSQGNVDLPEMSGKRVLETMLMVMDNPNKEEQDGNRTRLTYTVNENHWIVLTRENIRTNETRSEESSNSND